MSSCRSFVDKIEEEIRQVQIAGDRDKLDNYLFMVTTTVNNTKRGNTGTTHTQKTDMEK